MKGGELLFVGFEGTRLAAGERAVLRRLEPAGITLVPRNVGDERELRELLADLRALCPRAILALDAEGGRVDRLRRIVGPAPAAGDLARHAPRRARSSGRWVGAALRHFGFDLDLAPVVDLDHGRLGNALDGRCFGATPRAVVARAGAFLDGLGAAGVGGCVKHFPGLGAAGEDTHESPSHIDLDRGALARELAPFRVLAARAGAVMASHAIYPALDPEQRPATLSSRIATGLLRRGLRFRGALLSDDLEMGALGPWGGLPERGEAALVAGCDGLLFCRRLLEAPAIARRLAATALASRRLQAAKRLERLRRDLAALRRRAGDPPPLAEVRRRLARLHDAVAAD